MKFLLTLSLALLIGTVSTNAATGEVTEKVFTWSGGTATMVASMVSDSETIMGNILFKANSRPNTVLFFHLSEKTVMDIYKVVLALEKEMKSEIPPLSIGTSKKDIAEMQCWSGFVRAGTQMEDSRRRAMLWINDEDVTETVLFHELTTDQVIELTAQLRGFVIKIREALDKHPSNPKSAEKSGPSSP